MFWISGDVSFRFQIQSGICLICQAPPPLDPHLKGVWGGVASGLIKTDEKIFMSYIGVEWSH